ncbi:GGDEF domain-containing protein [Thalassotalea sp. M1531]|uniref:diguanylate cyclase n=1 Tax=Thalassotalea algicola TaxID=2716224 RepID=A0A7Y0Q4J0_9GAMM|nr:GGDEF domain-containing protein [Thalassotalea algicola]NMP30004.1 GGDEF domain-containing protein [Thalassotalea algicola]
MDKTYHKFERKFKREIYRLSFIIGAVLCSIYLYRTYMRGDYLDATANLIAVTFSISGLVFLHFSKNVGRIHFIPAVICTVLFIGSFAGVPSNPDSSNLFWCLIFLPCIVLTLGHIRSVPYLIAIQVISYYWLFIDYPDWMNVNYSQHARQTYIVSSNLLIMMVWLSEYMRFKLASGLYRESLEKSRMHYLSNHDELTSLYNRRGFKEKIAAMQSHNKRQIDQHAIILIDIDDFKLVNDNYGHRFGDLVLKNIARLQLATVRSTDCVVRWGGEEFLILLSNIQADQVKKIAENIRKNIEKTPVANNKHSINVTVSIGVAFSEETENIETLIDLADQRLYAAKSGGKNCILFASPLTH